MSANEDKKWYADVKEITTRLVRIPSVSPSEGENKCAEEISTILSERGLNPNYQEIEQDTLEEKRCNVWAILEGGASQHGDRPVPTIVLIGHYDTVGVEEYKADGLDAFAPEQLQEHFYRQYLENEQAEDEILKDAGSKEWMFGRGSFDMKSGIAAQIAVMAALAKRKDLPGNVILIATPDEENESAGILAAVELLLDLRRERNLEYVGIVNSDYTAPREKNDPNRYIYRGTIGKLLPCFYIRGRETHVGEAFRGLDANLIAANLIQEIDLDAELCDEAEGEITVPPVTLKYRDLKGKYNVQTPFESVVYFNFLTHSFTPEDVLLRLKAAAEHALAKAIQRRGEQWDRYAAPQSLGETLEELDGRVWTYEELHKEVEERIPPARLQKLLEDQAFGYLEPIRELREKLGLLGQLHEHLPDFMKLLCKPEGFSLCVDTDSLLDRGQLADIDSREKSLSIVRALIQLASEWGILKSGNPAVVVYYAPPFYPHMAGNRESALTKAIDALVSSGVYGDIQHRAFYPYISDSSYVKLDESVRETIEVLKSNMPLWKRKEVSAELGDEFYDLPLDLIQDLDCDIVNIGPWGKEAHGKGERVYMPYSFETVPELLHNVILRALGDATVATRGEEF